MFRKFTSASAVLVALAFGGLAAPAFATSGLTPGGGEASATPHPSPGKAKRGDVKQQVPAARADSTLGANAGEGSGTVERPRTSTKARDQVKQETRAARDDRRTADGFERVGGEGGLRTAPGPK